MCEYGALLAASSSPFPPLPPALLLIHCLLSFLGTVVVRFLFRSPLSGSLLIIPGVIAGSSAVAGSTGATHLELTTLKPLRASRLQALPLELLHSSTAEAFVKDHPVRVFSVRREQLRPSYRLHNLDHGRRLLLGILEGVLSPQSVTATSTSKWTFTSVREVRIHMEWILRPLRLRIGGRSGRFSI